MTINDRLLNFAVRAIRLSQYIRKNNTNNTKKQRKKLNFEF